MPLGLLNNVVWMDVVEPAEAVFRRTAARLRQAFGESRWSLLAAEVGVSVDVAR